MKWQKEAYQYLLNGNYNSIVDIYEKLVDIEPNTRSHYWYLGLCYLLQGQEDLSQLTWLLTLSQAGEEEYDLWTKELIDILDKEAHRQFQTNNIEVSWLVRQNIQEIAPASFNNALILIQLSIDLDCLTDEYIQKWNKAKSLQETPYSFNPDLVLQTLEKALKFPSPETLRFTEDCLLYVHSQEVWSNTLINAIEQSNNEHRDFAIRLVELCIKVDPDNLSLWNILSQLSFTIGSHQKSIEIAKKFYCLSHGTPWKPLASYTLLRALLEAGEWKDILDLVPTYKSLLSTIDQETSKTQDYVLVSSLCFVSSLLQYYQDCPQENRYYQNKLAKSFQNQIQVFQPDVRSSSPIKITKISEIEKPKPLRIGYIAHTLRIHSVGWLSRWLFHYHDKNLFHISVYFVDYKINNWFTQKWFINNADSVYYGDVNPQKIFDKIQEDKIDILVDLDSNSHYVTSMVMALKPAPVQVTWLGYDASGIPNIDYFIADPYVLPDSAQAYYQEKIWRLPHTYVSVDGFEVDVPTLHRDHLDIPLDSIVYLSAQRGYKRHPHTIRVQMQVLNKVPNSYLLIKGLGDDLVIQKLFVEIALEGGVDPKRLRFLERDPNEFCHRANLKIADVILDTYPYNGATTTLEALWMCIPVVTRVGEQFAARNSYTFMMNVGVTEGIAWSDEEYIEWAISLGVNESLRRKVVNKLRLSKQTSPLWNAKQFTREMENTYQQMWAKYVETLR